MDMEHSVESVRAKLEESETEKQRMEKLRAGMMEEVKYLANENHRLISSNSDAQRRMDQLEIKYEDLHSEKERLEKELERWLGLLKHQCNYIISLMQ